MSTIRIKIHQQGTTYVTLDRDDYEEARDAHAMGGLSSRLDRLLHDAISGMDTEVTITEPDGSEFDL